MALSRRQRLELVAAAVRSGTWGPGAVQEIAAQAGVKPGTVYRDFEALLSMAEDSPRSREQRRALFLLELEGDIEKARQAKSWTALASLRRLQAQVGGLASIPPPEKRKEREEEPAGDAPVLDRLRAQLQVVRRLRENAEDRGSHVAAVQALRAEAEINAQIAELEREQREREASAGSDEQVLARFKAALDRLPDALVDELVKALEARRR